MADEENEDVKMAKTKKIIVEKTRRRNGEGSIYQEKNGLWAEGSDYILNMYPEEEGWSAYGGV